MGKSQLTSRVMKALGVFSSLEMLTMLCTIVRTKLIALWIGAAGVGVMSLYSSTVELLRTYLDLNLRQTSVREISAASPSEREERQTVSLGLGFIIGLAGTIITALLSPLLSLLTFGSYDYTWGFAALSVTMLFTSMSEARRAVLQATERLAELARVSLYSAVGGSLAAVAFIYFFGMQGIIPVMVAMPLIVLLCLYLPRIRRCSSVPRRRFMAMSKRMLVLGGYISFATGLGLLAMYVLRIYLNHVGTPELVGRFQAGYMIVNTYVGIIFTAISMEFYPRLSTVISRPRTTSVTVSHEITLSMWLLLPVIVIFICADEAAIRILYSEEFIEALPYLTIGILAIPMRAASWCFSYVILAKGDGKTYIVTEGISAVALPLFSYIGWNAGGFAGLGLAYVAQYAVFLAATWIVYRRRYRLTTTPAVGRLLALSLATGVTTVILKLAVGWWLPALLILPWLIPASIRHVRR